MTRENIELKNYEIITIVNSLNRGDSILKSNDPSRKYPISLLWRVSGNLKKLNELATRVSEEETKINELYFTEERSDINEDGSMTVKEEFRDEFVKAKNELFEIVNSVEIDKVNVKDIENLDMAPLDFASIEFMLTEE